MITVRELESGCHLLLFIAFESPCSSQNITMHYHSRQFTIRLCKPIYNQPITSVSRTLLFLREYTNGVRWVSSKSNTEFFSTSTDGRAMWWDTRWLQHPTEVIVFNLENLNEPDMDRAVGVSCLNFGPVVGTKFVFGMDNGVLLTGSKKAKTNMEKVSSRFPAHFGPVVSVDRSQRLQPRSVPIRRRLDRENLGGGYQRRELDFYYVC